ncbi:hypothetical protein KKA14_03715 [bacterium]|nr:hypothetical protein [bacterium]
MDLCNTASESLNKKLQQCLNHVNKARIKFLASLIIGILTQRTICYDKIARSFVTKSKLVSIYRNIQRFFANFTLDEGAWARLIADMALQDCSKWIITIDQTNWKIGQSNINFLVLAVAKNGVAIPLFWIPLDKRGNSNCSERESL